MGSHSVTCHLAAVTFLPLPQPKLVLDLAPPEGCKAVLTWLVVTSQDSEITCRMGSLTVTCHPAVVTYLPLPQAKLVLDIATTERCKVELIWVVVTYHDSEKNNYVIFVEVRSCASNI